MTKSPESRILPVLCALSIYIVIVSSASSIHSDASSIFQENRIPRDFYRPGGIDRRLRNRRAIEVFPASDASVNATSGNRTLEEDRNGIEGEAEDRQIIPCILSGNPALPVTTFKCRLTMHCCIDLTNRKPYCCDFNRPCCNRLTRFGCRHSDGVCRYV